MSVEISLSHPKSKETWRGLVRGSMLYLYSGARGNERFQRHKMFRQASNALKMLEGMARSKERAGFVRNVAASTSLPRGEALIAICLEKLGRKTNKTKAKARPVNKKNVAQLRLGRHRLPPSLSRFLEFDLTFASCFPNDTFGFGRDPRRPLLEPVDLNVVLARWLRSYARDGVDLKRVRLLDGGGRLVRSLSALAPDLPAGKLYQLPRQGEQIHFLYVGKPSATGEFPIVALDWEGGVGHDGVLEGRFTPFLKYPAFDVFLADQLGVEGDAAFGRKVDTELRAAKRRNPGLSMG
jgi:hypothetical protein